MTFGRYLRLLREDSKTTLRSLSRSMGWSASYLSDIELGRRGAPSGLHIIKIGRFLKLEKVAIATLLGLAEIEKFNRQFANWLALRSSTNLRYKDIEL